MDDPDLIFKIARKYQLIQNLTIKSEKQHDGLTRAIKKQHDELNELLAAHGDFTPPQVADLLNELLRAGQLLATRISDYGRNMDPFILNADQGARYKKLKETDTKAARDYLLKLQQEHLRGQTLIKRRKKSAIKGGDNQKQFFRKPKESALAEYATWRGNKADFVKWAMQAFNVTERTVYRWLN